MKKRRIGSGRVFPGYGWRLSLTRSDHHLPTAGRVRSRGQAALKAVMPAAAVAAVFAILTLFNVWDKTPPAFHALAFITTVVVLALGVLHVIRALIAPSPRRALHWGWYMILPPLVVVAVFAAGDDWQRRLVVGVRPGLLFPPPAMDIEATVTPPAYTHLQPIKLKRAADGAPLVVPEESRLMVRASGADYAPLLAWGSDSVLFRPETPGVFAIEGDLKSDGAVRVTFAGRELAAWHFTVKKDKAPTVALSSPPEYTARGSLRIAVEASDDHGVEYMALRLRKENGEEALIDLPAYGTKRLEEVSYRDLRAHSFAGSKVTADVVAVDGRSQEGASVPVTLTLRKRVFNNGLAQSLAAAREVLLTGEMDDLERAVRRLAAVSESGAYAADTTVQLGVRTAYQRLRSGISESERDEIASLLWDLALRAEDGTLSLTEDGLHDALEAMIVALKKGVPAEDADVLLHKLAAAFEAYGRARTSRIMVGGRRNGPFSADRDGIDWKAVQRYLSRLSDMISAGDRGDAVAQLSDLEDGLEASPDLLLSVTAYRRFLVASYARKLVDDLAREQRRLLSRSVGPLGGIMGSEKVPQLTEGQRRLAGDQAALRNIVVDLIGQLDRAGLDGIEAVRRAKSSMDEALKSLESGEADGAAAAQVQVLTALDLAAKALASIPSPLTRGSDGRLRDPLGRPLPPQTPLPATGVEGSVGHGRP